jgi:hypothetical protein
VTGSVRAYCPALKPPNGASAPAPPGKSVPSGRRPAPVRCPGFGAVAHRSFSRFPEARHLGRQAAYGGGGQACSRMDSPARLADELRRGRPAGSACDSDYRRGGERQPARTDRAAGARTQFVDRSAQGVGAWRRQPLACAAVELPGSTRLEPATSGLTVCPSRNTSQEGSKAGQTGALSSRPTLAEPTPVRPPSCTASAHADRRSPADYVFRCCSFFRNSSSCARNRSRRCSPATYAYDAGGRAKSTAGIGSQDWPVTNGRGSRKRFNTFTVMRDTLFR